ncbi:MAG: aspartate/glutamate racemase family protein [Pseudomonadota bacterium]
MKHAQTNGRPRQSRGRGRIGVVVPVTNTNLEPDMMMLAPEGVSLHFSRSGGYDVDAIPDEKQMRQYSDQHSPEVVDNLRLCRSDVILYGCTSATLAQGPAYDRQFRQEIEAQTGIPAITAASALVEAISDVGDKGSKAFALSSPYVARLNDLAISFIEAFGHRCVGRADAEKPLGNDDVAALSPDDVMALAERANNKEAQVIVLSCTDMRAAEAVPEIERRLSKPVVTSNQALMAWAIRRLGLPFEGTVLANHRLVADR